MGKGGRPCSGSTFPSRFEQYFGPKRSLQSWLHLHYLEPIYREVEMLQGRGLLVGVVSQEQLRKLQAREGELGLGKGADRPVQTELYPVELGVIGRPALEGPAGAE